MNAEFFNALDLLEQENGISKEYMISQIELALANACRKELGASTVIRVQLDANKKDMRVFQQRTVVPDGEVYDDKSEISAALRSEGDRILRNLPKDAYKVALCVEGKSFDSVALAKQLEDGTGTSGKLALVIGSSHGLDESVKAACDLRLSVSKLTFPHQLMRVLLMEILYRSFTIMKGKRYHK